MPKNQEKIVSNNLRKYRLTRDISQTQLAILSGYSRQWINRIEKGTKNPSYRFKKTICNSLIVKVEEVFDV